eukprot:TRINITY_DN4350_c0_g1_i3.p1 TRINITY_DN4350_c0_g1~~TRINITY_DN4350_c0_g1_i3.p1  ORF type:complete len:357 (-),score=57.56 TRINITY_DN4350_c0_g1_i3:180-1250(-)
MGKSSAELMHEQYTDRSQLGAFAAGAQGLGEKDGETSEASRLYKEWARQTQAQGRSTHSPRVDLEVPGRGAHIYDTHHPIPRGTDHVSEPVREQPRYEPSPTRAQPPEDNRLAHDIYKEWVGIAKGGGRSLHSPTRSDLEVPGRGAYVFSGRDQDAEQREAERQAELSRMAAEDAERRRRAAEERMRAEDDERRRQNMSPAEAYARGYKEGYSPPERPPITPRYVHDSQGVHAAAPVRAPEPAPPPQTVEPEPEPEPAQPEPEPEPEPEPVAESPRSPIASEVIHHHHYHPAAVLIVSPEPNNTAVEEAPHVIYASRSSESRFTKPVVYQSTYVSILDLMHRQSPEHKQPTVFITR